MSDPPIPDENPFENPDDWTFYCEDCDRRLDVDDAREHRDTDHDITTEYQP